jgi:hypothetical protein
MRASDLIHALQNLVEKYDDLPVTFVFGQHEYSVLEPTYTKEGPIPKIGNAQGQILTERFVLEPKDDIEKG